MDVLVFHTQLPSEPISVCCFALDVSVTYLQCFVGLIGKGLVVNHIK